tara:strand:- start:655 stop:1071 length:417 start_codon:yes stop_codon:yes gene_type:complete
LDGNAAPLRDYAATSLPVSLALGIDHTINIGEKLKDKLLFIEIVLGVFALGFSSLWVLYPVSNLEPLLVLLGFIITFSEIDRRRNKSQLDEPAIPQVPVFSEKNLRVNPKDNRLKSGTTEKKDEADERMNINSGTVAL